tara:strand:- start:1073 stop:1264 length:192 start_codon:yes stop_codon:yes gene_type:complete
MTEAKDLIAPPEVETHGSLSVVVPMEDMKDIIQQLWKSRSTEKRCGELYNKYKELTTFDDDSK